MATVYRGGMTGGSREERLSEAFVDLADTLVDDFDVLDFLHALATHCIALLDVDEAGLMLADGSGRLVVTASSTEQVRLLELFEVQNDEGPCLDCYASGEPVVVDDLAADQPPTWPRFGAEATAAGFRSVVALPLRLRNETIGALNLFRAEPGAAGRGRPVAGAGTGRRRHDRHPPGARQQPARAARPAAPGGPEQSHRDRAGQGGPRGACGRARRCRLPAAARLRPQPRAAALRGRPPGRGPRPRPRPDVRRSARRLRRVLGSPRAGRGVVDWCLRPGPGGPSSAPRSGEDSDEHLRGPHSRASSRRGGGRPSSRPRGRTTPRRTAGARRRAGRERARHQRGPARLRSHHPHAPAPAAAASGSGWPTWARGSRGGSRCRPAAATAVGSSSSRPSPPTGASTGSPTAARRSGASSPTDAAEQPSLSDAAVTQVIFR